MIFLTNYYKIKKLINLIIKILYRLIAKKVFWFFCNIFVTFNGYLIAIKMTIKSLYTLIFCLSILLVKAQVGSNQKHFVFNKKATVTLGDITQDFAPTMLVREMPKPGSEKMVQYNYPETKEQNKISKTSVSLTNLVLGYSAVGNPWGVSTPNDNDIAISNDGIIMSVVNSNIYVKDINSATVTPVKSLAAFTAPVNSKHQESDPKVLYDPKSDRFIFMCFTGFVDTTSKLIFGFSQTNNPNGAWNLYTLPGNPLNNNLWSDYPMLAMTEKELFLSINLLHNDSSWQTGFVETIIWQIKKDSGYAGLPLGALLHSNIKYGSKSIRNLCPAKGGSKLYKPNMYFISNRNFASMNDTVFLVNVTDTIGAPTNTVTVKVLVSDQPYYFPPTGRQPNAAGTAMSTQSLACNDARTLGAFFENNTIQYVHNTKNPLNNQVTAYYGIVSNPQNPSPVARGYIIANDSMDFGYPNISYGGSSSVDNTAIINFNHSSPKVYAGCSAIRADAVGNFSSILRIQNGVKPIDVLSGNEERWGDYSGSQVRYSKPGEVWISGYYGYTYNSFNKYVHAAWIAQIATDASILVGVKEADKNTANTLLYPNPAQDLFSIDFTISKPEYMTFELYDAQGKLVEVLMRDWIKINQNTFQFSLRDLNTGIYFLKITGNNNTNITKKIIKQ